MYSIIGSNIIFNIIEYFSFINLCLLFLFIIISLCFILIKCTLLYYSNVNINHCLIEFISTLFSLLFLILIISPALIILLDFDLIILPSFIIYSLGLQWAWQFNIIFLPINIGFESYCDHYIISSINKKSTFINNYYLKTNNYIIKGLLYNSLYSVVSLYIITNYWFKSTEPIIELLYKSLYILTETIIEPLNINYKPLYINEKPLFTELIIEPLTKSLYISTELIIEPLTETLMVTRYLFDISQYIILPIYSFIRLFVYSFDVIHTLGFYSWGIKIDAIPGRINLATTLRLLWKGEYRGKCFELCGQGHLSMLITTLILLV